jgi:uncharacterized protein (DUF433 family)
MSNVVDRALTIHADSVPLRTDEHGAVRVGRSRVVLDVVIEEFENGADPEGIVHAYPSLDLADVYAVIAYYLRHKEEVRIYLLAREAAAGRLREEVEANHPDRVNLRQKLLARREQMEQGRAAPGK